VTVCPISAPAQAFQSRSPAKITQCDCGNRSINNMITGRGGIPSVGVPPARTWRNRARSTPAAGRAGTGASGDGQGACGEGRHETGTPRCLNGVCRRTLDHGAGTGFVAGVIGPKSAPRLVTSGCRDVVNITMHFHN